MPIANLRFNLDEEEYAFKAALQGQAARAALWEIDQCCRSLIKHGEPTPEARQLASEIRMIIAQSAVDLDQ